jgi:hypothetical protein
MGNYIIYLFNLFYLYNQLILNRILSLLILLLETKEDTPADSPAARNLPYSHSAPSLGGHAKPDEAAPKKEVKALPISSSLLLQL